MNILLTGGSGFLGRAILNIIKVDNKVFTLGRKNSNFNIDISKGNFFLNESFDCVIHAASLAHVQGNNPSLIDEIFKTNVNGTLNLLMSLEDCKLIKKFVYISSVSVYGLNSGLNISENEPLSAMDAYGLSKIKAETIISNWCKDRNIKCTILRLPLLIGKNPPGNLGSLIKAIKNNYYFNIAGGISRKSMVLVEDIANFILVAAEHEGIYNLTDGYNPSFKELSLFIAEQFNKKFIVNIPFIFAWMLAKIGDIIGDKFPINSSKLIKITSNLTFDDTRARLKFNWRPEFVLKKGNFK